MKATAVAPSNIAFIKYWGKKDESLRLPANGSISMNLNSLLTTTTVEFNRQNKTDEVLIDGKIIKKEEKRVIEHLDRIRTRARIVFKAKVVSKNIFPSGTGLSSSASGFAALTVAASNAAGLKLSEKELTVLARLGSGSACRSIPDGFVEWIEGDNSNNSYAVSLFAENYWDIVDVVTVISEDKKNISSTDGQKLVRTSPFFNERLLKINQKISLIKKLIREKKFCAFGETVEREALELHAIMLTSQPSLIYWLPNTIIIMKHVISLRKKGLPVYFTINTGQDVHLIAERKNLEPLMDSLKKIKIIKKIIINQPAVGTKLIDKHLF